MLQSRVVSLKNLLWVGVFLAGIALVLFFVDPLNAEAQSSTGLSVLQSDTNRVVLELVVAGYNSRDVTVSGATYTLFSIGDLGRTDEPGKPQLPVKGTMIGIPPGAQPTLRIVDDQSQTIAVPRHPLPAPTITVQRDPRQTLPGPMSQAFAPNASTFSTNQFYPSAAAKIGTTGDWRSQRYATVQFYPLQYNPVTRQLVLHRRLRVEITLSYPRGQSPATLGSGVNEGAFESIFENAFINYPEAKNWRAPRPAAPTARRAAPALSGDWYKIGVNADGIYTVTCGLLAQAKGTTLNITPGTLQLFNLQVYTAPVEYAINVVGNGWNNGSCNATDQSDYIEFFGLAPTSIYTNTQAPFNKYTNTNIYWLTYGASSGKRMATRDGTPGAGTPATSYTQTAHLAPNLTANQDWFYYPAAPTTEGFEHWYLGTGIDNRASQTYTFTLDYLASSSISPTLVSDLVGGKPTTRSAVVNFNSCHAVDAATLISTTERLNTVSFPQSCLISGTNTIVVTSTASYSAGDFILSHYFDVSYQRTFNVVSDTIRFPQALSNTWQYTITGFTNSAVETFDITDPFSVTQISTPAPVGGPPYTLSFSDTVTASARNYIALATAQRKAPTSVVKYAPSNPDLRNASNHADYIIISATLFKALPSTIQLAALRNSQFPNGATIIDVQDIYDQFNNGLVDPQAIRDFLACAYGAGVSPCSGWGQSTRPQFVLLIGGGTFDPKGYCASPNVCSQYQTVSNSTLIPPYLRMVEPYVWGETDSDNCLVAFAVPCSMITHTLPYLSIGRFPADTAADVTALVSKTINYEPQNLAQGLWRSTVSFVAANSYDENGNPDPGGDFWAASDNIASNPTYFPAGLIANRLYFNPCTNTTSYPWCALPYYPSYSTSSSVHTALVNAINSGRIIINYVGHSWIQYWQPKIGADLGTFFSDVPGSSDLPSLTNGNKTPVMLELTCRTGYFIYPHPALQSLAKLNVNLAVNGVPEGAVASWAAVGDGVVSGHDWLEKGFFDAVMNHNTRRLGPAITAGKANLYSSGYNLDLIDTTLLFGDPAASLPIQFLKFEYLPLIEK